jgi:hypothetical protein
MVPINNYQSRWAGEILSTELFLSLPQEELN